MSEPGTGGTYADRWFYYQGRDGGQYRCQLRVWKADEPFLVTEKLKAPDFYRKASWGLWFGRRATPDEEAMWNALKPAKETHDG